jgi:hypothetical protein
MKNAILGTAGLFVGGMLYVLARTRSLLMFKWFEVLGIGQEVQALRAFGGPYVKSLPQWVYFSLPQALWCFSGLLLFSSIWGFNSANLWPRRAWILAFSVFAVGLEVGQGLHWVPGRFDIADLMLLIIAICASTLVARLDNGFGAYRKIQED